MNTGLCCKRVESFGAAVLRRAEKRLELILELERYTVAAILVDLDPRLCFEAGGVAAPRCRCTRMHTGRGG